MQKINEDENDDGGGDDNDSVWGGDSTWGGGDQDDFSVSVYNAKAPAMGKGSRPKAVPISRIQIGGPAPPSSSEKRTSSSSHSRKQLLPPSGNGNSGKPKSMGTLGAPAAFHSKRPGGGGSGFQGVSAPQSSKSLKDTNQRKSLSENQNDDWNHSFEGFEDFDDFGAPIVPANHNHNHNHNHALNTGTGTGTGTVRVKSKAAEMENDRFADQARMHRSHCELPSFDIFENSSTLNKPLRQRSSREENSDAASVNSVNESLSLSLDGFPRAAISTEGNGSRASDASKDRRSETSTRSTRSTDKPARSQRSIFNTNIDGEKERSSRGERSSDRSQRRGRSVDMSREKSVERSTRVSRSKSPSRSGRHSTSPTQQRRALRRERSKSPGKFKDRPDRAERRERTVAERKERSGRSQSLGKLRNRVRDGRSKSPGALSRRTVRQDRSYSPGRLSTPGRLSNTGSRRRAVENQTAPRRSKSDDFNNSFSEMANIDLGVDTKKADEDADEGRRRRGVARAKSMDMMSKPRGTKSTKSHEKDDSETDQPTSKGEAERKPLRKTKSDRPKELGSALTFVDNQAGSVRKTRRRADDRSYKSEGSSKSTKNHEKYDSETDQPTSKGEAERKPVRRTRSGRTKELGSALTFVDSQAGSIRKTRRRADDRSYKSEGTSLRHLTSESRRVRRTAEPKKPASSRGPTLMDEIEADTNDNTKESVRLVKEKRKQDEVRLKRLKEEARLLEEKRLSEEARINALKEESKILEGRRKDEEARMKAAAELAKEQREAEASSLREQLLLAREQRLADEARIARLREEAQMDKGKSLVKEAPIKEETRLLEENQIHDESQNEFKTVEPDIAEEGNDDMIAHQAPVAESNIDQSNSTQQESSPPREQVEYDILDEHQADQTEPPPEETPKKLRPWEIMQARKAADGPQITASLEILTTDPPSLRRKSSLDSRLKKFGGGADASLPPAFQMLAKAKK
jgi:hypothetical protein